jgi:hypothetical protein
LAGRVSTGYRFDDRIKSFVLQLKGISPKAYRILRKIFKLPSFKTLTDLLNKINIRPGFHPAVFEALREQAKGMSPLDKMVIVPFDEMSLKQNISYDPKKEEVEGLEDMGEGIRGEKVANHASVFMARGITKNWKQPIGYFLSNSTMSPKNIQQKMVEGIKKLQSVGLCPVAIVMDQGKNNQSAMKILGCSTKEPFFTINGSRIYGFFDPPHLLKNIRTNFKKYGFSVGSKEAKWEHLEELYKHDSRKHIRMAPKLTQRHLELPAFSTMSVPLAAQVGQSVITHKCGMSVFTTR